MSSSKSEAEVYFNVVNDAGIITLNRPMAMNALNLPMVQQIYPQLKAWEDHLKLVIIEGAGEKAFCAGGDIRAITESQGASNQTDFFKEEYILNHLIGTLKIPYVALIDGITMGGGVGLSVHGQYRVATERTVFAMPETGIGLIPDVGGGFFLPRLQGELGMFLALTGHRLKGSDCVHVGVATHGCPSESLDALKNEIIQVKDTRDIASILEGRSQSFLGHAKPFSLAPKLDSINECFKSHLGVDDILQALESHSQDPEWARQLIKTIQKMSPTSLAVTFRQLRNGAGHKTLAETLAMEFRLVNRCCEDCDFYEGVRAVLVDRDNAPKWVPSSLAEVTTDKLNHYFSPLSDGRDLSL
eukprot:snap_masked-scaffold1123_size61443-processed-gene-0.5 protein:Tk01074 transcript:snap_masked-scaffold1123_size61443-processed-gene-0.5-mRNA-1 annotation:"hypothetical protein CAPTEDRAFT_181091"